MAWCLVGVVTTLSFTSTHLTLSPNHPIQLYITFEYTGAGISLALTVGQCVHGIFSHHTVLINYSSKKYTKENTWLNCSVFLLVKSSAPPPKGFQCDDLVIQKLTL